jgi:hypothetical protein
VSLFSVLIRNRKEAFETFWHEFKNSVAVQIGLWTRDEITVQHSLPKQQAEMQLGPLKHHLRGCLFHSNEEVKKAVREFLRKQRPDFCPDGIFNLVPRRDRCFTVLWDYVEK